MINLKTWNVEHLGHMLLVSLVLVVVVAMVHIFVSPLLVTAMPTVFTTPITLTDTLLFLILLRLITK